MIDVLIYSKGDICGLFVDEGTMKDLYTVGVLPGGPDYYPPSQSLSYVGVYKNIAGLQILSGKAAVFTTLIGPAQSPTLFMGVILLKSDGTPLLSILWSPEDYILPIGAGGTTTLHADNSFLHSVKVNIP